MIALRVRGPSGPSAPSRGVLGAVGLGSSAYSTIVVSFVFAPYLTSTVGGPDAALGLSGATWLGISTAAAGVLIAVLAPVTGQRADEGGRRRASLALFTALVIASTLGLFFVKDSPAYLWLGLVLMAAGSVFMEFAYVSYNAMLHQISTPANIGRISGFGWGSGYLGGIVVLLAAYLLFISPEVGLFGVTDAEGSAIGCWRSWSPSGSGSSRSPSCSRCRRCRPPRRTG